MPSELQPRIQQLGAFQMYEFESLPDVHQDRLRLYGWTDTYSPLESRYNL